MAQKKLLIMGKAFTQIDFLRELQERNLKVFKKVKRVLAYDGRDVVLDTTYGTIKVRKQEIFKVSDIPLKSAVDKSDFWIRRNKYIRNDFESIDYSECIYIDNKTKVALTCKKHNYKYSQSPNHHIKGVQGCAYCMTQTVMYTKENIEAHRDFIEKIEGILYVLELKNSEEIFYKVGVVSKDRFKYRINQLSQKHIVTVLYTEGGDMVSIFNLEQRFLEEFKNYKYIPKEKFIGYTECLTVNPLEHYYKQ